MELHGHSGQQVSIGRSNTWTVGQRHWLKTKITALSKNQLLWIILPHTLWCIKCRITQWSRVESLSHPEFYKQRVSHWHVTAIQINPNIKKTQEMYQKTYIYVSTCCSWITAPSISSSECGSHLFIQKLSRKVGVFSRDNAVFYFSTQSKYKCDTSDTEAVSAMAWCSALQVRSEQTRLVWLRAERFMLIFVLC